MKKLKQKLELDLLKCRAGVKDFIKEECGDTNFLSIAIILIVVITVAVVFIAFKDTLLGGLNTAISNLKAALGI